MSLDIESFVAGRRGFQVGPLTAAVADGARVAIVGPNGCGKTTLLKTLAGLLAPLAGAVRVDGRAVAAARPAERARLLAYLPPPGEVEAPFSTRHVVALGRLSRRGWVSDLSRADEAAATEALARLGIDHLADRPFDRLSSGQRQLALLARTLVQDSRVVILDEPSATLDPARRAEVGRAVQALSGQGRMVVFSTHDIAEARGAELCVTLGEEIAVGPPEDLLATERLTALFGLSPEACGACGRRGI